MERALPNALGLLPEAFADACASTLRWPRGRGLRVYSEIFRHGEARTGPRDAPKVFHASPIVRELRESCEEGEVIKFLTRVPVDPAASPIGSAAPNAVHPGAIPGPGTTSSVADRFPHLDIESVLIPMVGRKGVLSYTLCVSSQVGCAMGCTFCETAQMGLIRSLTPAEIVGQWFNARHIVGKEVNNIVFMGMGEPLDNYDNVIAAIAILKDHLAAAVPTSKITISTVGRVDGIEKLKIKILESGWHRLGIALSLNAPSDAVRDQIMPINRKWTLAELQTSLLAWPKFGGNKISFESVLIPGVNDSDEHAAMVGEFYAPFRAQHPRGLPEAGGATPRALVNLIPYNPRRESPWPAPTEERIERFMELLSAAGVYVKRRRTKGRKMMGACGQLGTAEIRRRQIVGQMAGQPAGQPVGLTIAGQ
jgi:23S rRNA (adenine2503-C2)-methyltransferase